MKIKTGLRFAQRCIFVSLDLWLLSHWNVQ
jgi:hypothetical protein